MKTITCDSSYPKVLIFGQPFNNSTGGGITLTNLFKGWSKDNIAVLFAPWDGDAKITTDICCMYYQIGKEEHRWRFPFNLYKRRFPQSGLIKDADNFVASACSSKTSLKHKLASRVLNQFIEWLGMHHCYSQITLSDRLTNWLTGFHPEILYLQVSSLETITFACQLIDFLKIPSVIHMMDDWPSTISTQGPLRNYWNKKIDREFKQLLNKVDLHLSICDAMSEEYKTRYGHEFTAFHNTIDLHSWPPGMRTSFESDEKEKTILFSGRIGTGIQNSIFELASAVEKLTEKGIDVKLHIQSPVITPAFLEEINKYSFIVINPPAEYTLIPKLYTNADILIITNDFNDKGIKLLKFSMPTKAPEYMISGTPVLVYASEETAVSKFFSQNECGYCVTEPGVEKIEEAIRFLIFNKAYRNKISRNAVELAKNRFDGEIVRREFQNLLIAAAKKTTNIHKN